MNEVAAIFRLFADYEHCLPLAKCTPLVNKQPNMLVHLVRYPQRRSHIAHPYRMPNRQ
jgi:hypothetical protein